MHELSKESSEVLHDLIAHEGDGEYWQKRVNGLSHRDYSILRGCFDELRTNGKKLWKSINWLSVAKQVGTIGFSLATGTAPLTILTSAFDTLRDHVDSKEHIEEAIETIGGYIKNAYVSEDTSSLKEFNEFQKNFKELLNLAGIEKLVVIIDDLDRCLPAVAIETLEAVRMFMFMEETAFVIGADEIMIRYAVKKHFPDMEREKGVNIGDDFADKYLEKLIQIPFRIPALGPVESQLYITLLMIGSVRDLPEPTYKSLVEASLKKLEKPWDITPFNISEIKSILGDEHYKKVTDQSIIAVQISPILYQYSRGNPRVIKRFINMLFLRYAVAKNKGYGADLDLQILAKLMLAERRWPKLYENIAMHLINGKSSELAYLEDEYSNDAVTSEVPELSEETEKKQSTDKKAQKSRDCRPKTPPKDIDWIKSNDYKEWIVSRPSLKNHDLRPYYTACKEKTDYFGGLESDEALRELVDILMKDEAIVVGAKDRIQGLTEENAVKAFNIVSANISAGDLSNEPAGFSGLRVLTEVHPALRNSTKGLHNVVVCAEIKAFRDHPKPCVNLQSSVE